MNQVLAIPNEEARVTVTHQGQTLDLPDTVAYNLPDTNIKFMVQEVFRTGGIPNFATDPQANFDDYVVERCPAIEARPYNLITVRPKVTFGCKM
jgi:hypothetical protein